MLTFQEWSEMILLEVAKDIADELSTWADENEEKLPFPEMFPRPDGQWVSPSAMSADSWKQPTITRVVVPFKADKEAISILDKIHERGLKIDYKDGLVISHRPGRTPEEPARQTKVRLGKYILNPQNGFSEPEKKWWNRRGQAIQELQEAENAQKYAVIISRNPIDIVRMSDHDGIKSCHSPGGDYFRCAIADAKGQGAVAYVVRRQDLEGVDLQDPEIFADTNRGYYRNVPGIVPVARLRLRKFVNKQEEYELAVPEDRIYGKQIPGFKETVRKYALETQQEKLGGRRPSMDEFVRVGGKYADTESSVLFNNFFGDDMDDGDVDWEGDGESQSRYDQYVEEVEQIESEYRNKFTICSYWSDVQEGDDGMPYVDYHGTVFIEIPSEWVQSTLPDYGDQERRQIEKAIQDLAGECDIWGVDYIEIEQETSKNSFSSSTHPSTWTYGDIRVRLDLRDEGDSYSSTPAGHPDRYRDFLEAMRSNIEPNAEKFRRGVYAIFMEHEIVKPSMVYTANQEWTDNQFQNFIYEFEDETTLNVQMINQDGKEQRERELIWLGNMKGRDDIWKYQKPASRYASEEAAGFNEFAKALSIRVHQWAAQANRQMFLPGFDKQEQKPFQTEIIPNIRYEFDRDKNVYMRFNMEIHVTHTDDEAENAMAFLKFIDNNFPKFLQEARQMFAMTVISKYKPVGPAMHMDLGLKPHPSQDDMI